MYKLLKTTWLVFVFQALFCLVISWQPPALAQTDPEIASMVQALKKDPRGPYQAIKWFCPDGRVLPAAQRCPEPGGVQHGLPKQWVSDLAGTRQIYLDLVLSGSSHDDIWDAAADHSRIKQHALVRYLFQTDDGWIYRRARYYRGAIQAEDEAAWGGRFLTQVLDRPDHIQDRFFVIREACRTIPHFNQNRDRLQTIRAVSKTLSDQIPEFMDLRVKIHGQPDAGDLDRVKDFVTSREYGLDSRQIALFNELIQQLAAEYAVEPSLRLDRLLTSKPMSLPALSETRSALARSKEHLARTGTAYPVESVNPFQDMADLVFKIRSTVTQAPPQLRLPLMDLSIDMEHILFSTIRTWEPRTLEELMDKCRVLIKAAAGCGYLETWEWEAVERFHPSPLENALPFELFRLKAEQLIRTVDWGTAMIQSVYLPEIQRFTRFEPQTAGFTDDRIRSSILLPLGDTLGTLAGMVQHLSGITHQLPDGVLSRHFRGMNAGLAYGVLEIPGTDSDMKETDPAKIYAFDTIPPELKPVAGMFTVSEGNLVSHVQLLARNLGIPNTVVSRQGLDSLVPWAGQTLFYAVSPGGVVVLKPDHQLTEEERRLVRKQERKQERFQVPTEKIALGQTALIRLSDLRALDSGRICGPKAANLGELKHLFPDVVGEGIVIPFGIFRQHMDQPMPGTGGTYWQFLTRALDRRANGEAAQMADLAELQSAIRTMPLLPGLETGLSEKFQALFHAPLGEVPVFIRSDTNMEDISDFTGAGLNLTVFNVRDQKAIFQGIRDVWASPYSERSYLWRQKYLENPENVFPSILLLPTVNVDRSGVVITRGIVSGSGEDITAAFSRGAGGAVEGQSAETYLMTGTGQDILFSPSREPRATRLPASGGVERAAVHFDQPLLTPDDRQAIRDLVRRVRQTIPGTPGIEGEGPYDIELGFVNGSLRLFQIRPFVENKKAGILTYLQSLDRMNQVPEAVLLHQEVTP
jgi:hypothetical protein